MKHHLNTLYVFTQGAYLRKESETVVVRIDKQSKTRLPLLNIGSIACFGRVGISPQLMGYCGQHGIAISFMTEHGRFLGRRQRLYAGKCVAATRAIPPG